MNKLLSKRLYQEADIPTPDFRSLTAADDVDIPGLIRDLGLPLVVKPACAGSSVGMTIVKETSGINQAIRDGFAHDDTLILEAYVKGVELTCGVLGNENLEALPVIEIIPGQGHEYFDFKAKYVAGETEEICPARLDDDLTRRVQDLAVRAHQALFLKGYSRTDMILSGNEIFVLETNTIPGMTATSLYPQSAAAAGYSFSQMLDTLIQLAIEEHKNKTKRRSQ
jgi:D-alanine-D-alanine ligase